MATLETFQSDVLLGQVGSSDLGYTVEEVVVTIAAGMKMGAALELTGGKYVWVEAANAANTNAILVDPAAEGYVEELAVGDHTLVVAKRGCTINKNKITYADGSDSAVVDAIAAAFEKAGANKVTANV